MDVIRLHSIGFRRGDRQILRGVSWTITAGQHWALLGANGSGKTTLLKIITGYEWPTEGSVEVLGQPFGACDLRQLRKTIGWTSSALLHQFPARDTALDVVLSGLDGSLGLYRAFTAAETDRARHALALLGCEGFAHQRYELLSQGEQQRVLIARSLVCEPALLILDEPCAGLDPAARLLFLDDLARLAARTDAPTLILVTHHIEEIGPWVSHLLLLKGGEVLGGGPKESILTSESISAAFEFPFTIEQAGQSCRLYPHSR